MKQSWPMIGRRDELARILAGLRSQVGTVVVGEAGVGKTVLAREVQRRLDDEGWHTHLVLCSGSSDFPLQAFAQATAVEGLEELPLVDRLQRTLGADGASVLVVDDAHLLDDVSAEMLWRLASGHNTLVLATVRSGGPMPHRVARLWADGMCDRVDLAPLTEEHIGALLELVLGGDVEDRLPRLLVKRAKGNTLLLRELVRSGIDSGAIVRSHEVWRLAGELPVGAGVADLIRGSLAELDTDELDAAQLLAIGEPLRLEVAESAIGDVMMEALERERIVTLQDTIEGPMVTLAHPLYGEVLRSDVAPLKHRRLRVQLIHAIKLSEAPSPHDVLRSALWRVELGETTDPADLLAAARLARSFSAEVAERLARAAMETGSLVDAVLLLAEILITQGRVVEADRLLDRLATDPLSTEQRQAVIYIRAMGRTRLGEMNEATAMIAGAATGAEENSLRLQAMYAQTLVLDGHMEESSALARPLLADQSADPITRTLAACALVDGGVFVGRFSESVRVMREALPAAEAARAALPYQYACMLAAATLALGTSGRLDEAEELGRQIYDRALAEDDEWLRPRGPSVLGVAALMRGQVRAATRYFRIAVASLNEFDGLLLRYNLSFLARGAALAGFVDEARQALQPPAAAPLLAIFQADWETAEAAVLAAGSDIAGAADRALGAARLAASIGQWATAAIAAHDAARYTGSEEASLLTAAAADRVDSPLFGVFRDHAHARSAADPRALSDSSERFEAIGTILYATEAAYAAGRAHRAAGDGRAAATATARATILHGRCENAVLPWVAGFGAVEVLSQREQQVALLAAASYPDAAIAAELRISVRTVQNHLARAYAKLGIASRHDLAEALG